jgi:putative acetyltransferase
MTTASRYSQPPNASLENADPEPLSAGQWQFRASQPDDVEQMYDVWHASVLATHDFLAKSDLMDICVLVRRDYLPNHSILVAVDDKDRVIGFMGMTDNGIDSLFIAPAHRSKGLGRDFVIQALSRADRLEVEVNAQNLQAVGFYEAMGFAVFASSPVLSVGSRIVCKYTYSCSGSSHNAYSMG